LEWRLDPRATGIGAGLPFRVMSTARERFRDLPGYGSPGRGPPTER